MLYVQRKGLFSFRFMRLSYDMLKLRLHIGCTLVRHLIQLFRDAIIQSFKRWGHFSSTKKMEQVKFESTSPGNHHLFYRYIFFLNVKYKCMFSVIGMNNDTLLWNLLYLDFFWTISMIEFRVWFPILYRLFSFCSVNEVELLLSRFLILLH